MPAGFFPQEVVLGTYGSWRYLEEPTLSAAGTGYTVGDTISYSGGTHPGGASTFTIASIDGSGGIASFGPPAVYHAYEAPFPSLPNALTGGTGTGATAGSYGSSYTPLVFVACPTVGAGFPASFSQLTYSAWVCVDIGSSIVLQASGFTTSPVGIYIASTITATGTNTADVQVTINLYPSPSGFGTPIYTGVWTGTVPTYTFTDGTGTTQVSAINVLVSFDSTDNTSLKVRANRTALTETSGGWATPAAFDNSSFNWFLFESAAFATTAGVADVWINDAAQDISNPTNEAQFINTDLSAVALPTNGQTSLGTIPLTFLHCLSSGSPADFATNGGTGSDWATYNARTLGSPPRPPFDAINDVPLAFSSTNCTLFTPAPPPGVRPLTAIIGKSLP